MMTDAEAAVSVLPIVLLPGMDGTGELLHELAGLLEKKRPVDRISYPEHGALGYAALTRQARTQMPATPFVILGESFSGPIAIELAATLPQVAGLILASSFARRPVPAMLAPLARRLDPRWAPRSLINAALLGSTGTREQRTQLHQILARIGAETLQTRAAEAATVDKLAQLATITHPILYLHGTRDHLIPRRCLSEVLNAQPKTQVRHVDAAHMLLCTHASEAAQHINRFCDEILLGIAAQ